MTVILVKLAGHLLTKNVSQFVPVGSSMAAKDVSLVIHCALYAMVQLKKTALAAVTSNFSIFRQRNVPMIALKVILVI